MGWFKRGKSSGGASPEQSGMDQAVVKAAVGMSRRGLLAKLPLVGGAAAGLTLLTAGTAQAANCSCTPGSQTGLTCTYNTTNNGPCGCSAGSSCGFTRTTCSGTCRRQSNGSVSCSGTSSTSCIASSSCTFC